MRENYEQNQSEHKDDERSLKELFMTEYFSHTPDADYSEIIKQAKLVEQSTPYAENLLDLLGTKKDNLSTAGEIIDKKTKDGVLLDLGCGSGLMRIFAELAGAKLYIGVDKLSSAAERSDEEPPSFSRVLNARVINMTAEEMEKELLLDDNSINQKIEPAGNPQPRATEELQIESCNEKAVLVESDMLVALSRLPDKSIATIIASGLEYDAVKGDKNTLYNDALQKEMQRVLVDKGIIVGYHSDVVPTNDKSFTRIDPGKKDWSFKILEKIPEEKI